MFLPKKKLNSYKPYHKKSYKTLYGIYFWNIKKKRNKTKEPKQCCGNRLIDACERFEIQSPPIQKTDQCLDLIMNNYYILGVYVICWKKKKKGSCELFLYFVLFFVFHLYFMVKDFENLWQVWCLRLVIMGCDILGKDDIFQSVRNWNEVVCVSFRNYIWCEFVISFLK